MLSAQVTICWALKTYFTAGVKEVRAWTVTPKVQLRLRLPVKSTQTLKKALFALKLSGYDHYIVEFNGEQGAQKMQVNGDLEGKDYIVKDGDVVHFRFNV